jgi:hypothetical protein
MRPAGEVRQALRHAAVQLAVEAGGGTWRDIATVERIVGNTVISQWLAQQSKLTVLEEMQAQRRHVA